MCVPGTRPGVYQAILLNVAESIACFATEHAHTCIEQLADPFQESIRFVVLVNVLCVWLLISLMVTREEF